MEKNEVKIVAGLVALFVVAYFAIIFGVI